MYQSERAGDEAKKRKSPAKSGRVGITVRVYKESQFLTSFKYIYIACTYSTSLRVILTTNNANDFVNAKSHTREKPLLAGYILL